MAADWAERVEHFATKIQPLDLAALECFEIDVGEPDPAAGDFRFLVAVVAAPGKRIGGQRLDERHTLGALQAAGPAIEGNAALGHELLGQAGRDVPGKNHRHRGPAAGHQLLVSDRRPLHADGGRPAAGRDVRDVKNAGTAVAAMREQEAAARFDRLRTILRTQPDI